MSTYEREREPNAGADAGDEDEGVSPPPTTTTSPSSSRMMVCSSDPPPPLCFSKEVHVRYFSSLLQRGLPAPYSSLDPQRLTVVHFCVHALDVLGVWDNHHNHNHNKKHSILEWVYRQQLTSGGFRGSPSCSPRASSSESEIESSGGASLAATYSALTVLRVLGDDNDDDDDAFSSSETTASRLNKKGIVQFIKQQQLRSGNFRAYQNQDGEADLRFVYCACASSYMLNDWSGIQIDLVCDFIQSCRTYEGSFSLTPAIQEGHGGATYCAIASLALLGKLEQVLDDEWKQQLIYWCVHRQQANGGGFQGRPNKPQDTCYSFWIGGTLRLLEMDHLLNQHALQDYILSNQHLAMGGFCKCHGAPGPDVLHAFTSLMWLGMSQKVKMEQEEEEEKLPLQLANAALGIRDDRAQSFRPCGGMLEDNDDDDRGRLP